MYVSARDAVSELARLVFSSRKWALSILKASRGSMVLKFRGTRTASTPGYTSQKRRSLDSRNYKPSGAYSRVGLRGFSYLPDIPVTTLSLFLLNCSFILRGDGIMPSMSYLSGGIGFYCCPYFSPVTTVDSY